VNKCDTCTMRPMIVAKKRTKKKERYERAGAGPKQKYGAPIRVHPKNVHWLIGRGLSNCRHVSIRRGKNNFDHIGAGRSCRVDGLDGWLVTGSFVRQYGRVRQIWHILCADFSVGFDAKVERSFNTCAPSDTKYNQTKNIVIFRRLGSRSPSASAMVVVQNKCRSDLHAEKDAETEWPKRTKECNQTAQNARTSRRGASR